jgi:hypothetical protein
MKIAPAAEGEISPSGELADELLWRIFPTALMARQFS